MSDLQAPANLLEDYEVEEIQVGEFTFRGDELVAVELPVKGFPAWRVTYEQGEGPRVLVSANAPIFLTGKKRVKVAEEHEDEPSADE